MYFNNALLYLYIFTVVYFEFYFDMFDVNFRNVPMTTRYTLGVVSQPLLNRRLHARDRMTASAVLLSRNNFQKVDLFAKFLKHENPEIVHILHVQDAENTNLIG